MRGKILMVTLWVASLFVFAACHDDDDDDDKGYKPKNAVVEVFNTKFPNATAVTWEKKGVYEKADFSEAGQECEAWFSVDGDWVMTEKDVLYANLPDKVKTGFTGSIYGSWKVEDVEWVDRVNTTPVYRLEIENANQEMYIYFNEEGELVKQVEDNAVSLPTAVNSFITQNYPKAVIVHDERWQDGNLEVDIIDDNQVKEVLFDRNNAWIETSWPVLQANVPQVVLDVLQGEAYNSYTIDTIHFIQYSSGEDVYHFTLKKEHSLDMTVEIYPDGSLVLG